MTALAVPSVQPLPPRPAASLFEWARAINELAARARSAPKGSKLVKRGNTDTAGAGRLLLAGGELDAGAVPHRTPGSEALGYRMAPDVAEHLAIDGLDPGFLGDIAGFSGLDSRDVQDFAGIDRTTVSRRKASGSALPQGLGIGAWPLAQPANRCRIAAGDLLRRVARAGAT